MKDLLMVYIEHVTTVMKVETDIINSIAASPIVNVELDVQTEVIVFNGNIVPCLMSH